MGGRLTP